MATGCSVGAATRWRSRSFSGWPSADSSTASQRVPSNWARITITITAQGVSPANIQIAVGSRVRFVNNDTRSHNMTSDPHPDHTTCPELNQVGLLAAGQSRESGNLNTVRTCGYHDHDNPGTASLLGSISIR